MKIRYVAQGPDHNGKWWVLDKKKGRYGTVFKAGIDETEAREIAGRMNGEHNVER